MKKFVSFIALVAISLSSFAQDDCVEVPTTLRGTASVRLTRYVHKIIPGVFSVAEGKHVIFSQGNLQYQASTNTWRFAENQWDIVGADNTNISSSNPDWIDLFGFGCSGWNNGEVPAYQPYYYTYTASNYLQSSLVGVRREADWAYHNIIINGGVDGAPAAGTWRVLSNDEWNNLCARVDESSNPLWGYGSLMGVEGVFLLPDAWSWSETEVAKAATAYSFSFVAASTSFSNNVIDDSENGVALWNAMETAGAVFLPFTGYRNGKSIFNYDTSSGSSYYWAVTHSSANNSRTIQISAGTELKTATVPKARACAVRPVYDL